MDKITDSIAEITSRLNSRTVKSVFSSGVILILAVLFVLASCASEQNSPETDSENSTAARLFSMEKIWMGGIPT